MANSIHQSNLFISRSASPLQFTDTISPRSANSSRNSIASDSIPQDWLALLSILPSERFSPSPNQSEMLNGSKIDPGTVSTQRTLRIGRMLLLIISLHQVSFCFHELFIYYLFCVIVKISKKKLLNLFLFQ